jgi:hypothetical protein
VAGSKRRQARPNAGELSHAKSRREIHLTSASLRGVGAGSFFRPRDAIRERRASLDQIRRAAEVCRARSLVEPLLEVVAG